MEGSPEAPTRSMAATAQPHPRKSAGSSSLPRFWPLFVVPLVGAGSIGLAWGHEIWGTALFASALVSSAATLLALSRRHGERLAALYGFSWAGHALFVAMVVSWHFTLVRYWDNDTIWQVADMLFRLVWWVVTPFVFLGGMAWGLVAGYSSRAKPALATLGAVFIVANGLACTWALWKNTQRPDPIAYVSTLGEVECEPLAIYVNKMKENLELDPSSCRAYSDPDHDTFVITQGGHIRAFASQSLLYDYDSFMGAHHGGLGSLDLAPPRTFVASSFLALLLSWVAWWELKRRPGDHGIRGERLALTFAAGPNAMALTPLLVALSYHLLDFISSP